MPKICQIPKVLYVHLWGNYANIQTSYKVAPINNVARIAVHRWCRMTMMIQENVANNTTAWLHILSWPLSQISQRGATPPRRNLSFLKSILSSMNYHNLHEQMVSWLLYGYWTGHSETSFTTKYPFKCLVWIKFKDNCQYWSPNCTRFFHLKYINAEVMICPTSYYFNLLFSVEWCFYYTSISHFVRFQIYQCKRETRPYCLLLLCTPCICWVMLCGHLPLTEISYVLLLPLPSYY